MNVNPFRPSAPDETGLSIPGGYARRVVWQPQIGDLFADFTVRSTHGPLRFFDWAEGAWVILFSYPAAHTPVCTTEMASLAAAREELAAHNVKALGLTASPLDDQHGWLGDIERIFGVRVTFPCAEDPGGRLARSFGMVHGKEAGQMPIRKTFIIDPALRIRAIQEYPMFVGRSTDETLRIVHALQAQDALGLATPADWFPGDVYVLPTAMDDAACTARHGRAPCRLAPYLATVDLSDAAPHRDRDG